MALGSSSQDCHLETAEAWLEAGSGLSLQMGSLRLPLVPLCAHKDPRDSGQFQGVCGLQAQSPGLLSHELPSSALWASHVMLSAPLPSLHPSGRWEKHPAKADGHEAGDPAPQGPPAARLSSCSAPLSGPALPSLQVLQGARGRCSWAIKPRGQAVSGGSCLPAEKQGTHLRRKVGEQLPWAPHYHSGGLALTGSWTSKTSMGFTGGHSHPWVGRPL